MNMQSQLSFKTGTEFRITGRGERLMLAPAAVSKKEFAALCNVKPTTVSKWIRQGKLSAEALEGTGRTARIKVAIAQGQLRKGLDVGQQLGNGATTDLGQASPAAQSDLTMVDRDAAPAAPTIEDELRKLKLRQAQITTERQEADRDLAAGRYVLTEHARAEVAKTAGLLLNIVEGALPDIANAFVIEFKLSQREVVHLLNQEFRKLRQVANDRLQLQASSLPRIPRE